MWFKHLSAALPVRKLYYKHGALIKQVSAGWYKHGNVLKKFWPVGSGGGGGGSTKPEDLKWEGRSFSEVGAWRVGGSDTHGFLFLNPGTGTTLHSPSGEAPFTQASLPSSGSWSKPAIMATYSNRWSWGTVQAGGNKAAYSLTSANRWMSSTLPREGGWVGIASLESQYDSNFALMYDSWVSNPETGGTEHDIGARTLDVGYSWQFHSMPSKKYWTSSASFQDDVFWGQMIATAEGGNAVALRHSSTGGGWQQVANIYSDGLNGVNGGSCAIGKRKVSFTSNGQTVTVTGYYAIVLDTSISANKSIIATYPMYATPQAIPGLPRWSPRQLPTPGRWVSICYGGGYWIILEYGSSRCLISHWESFEDFKVVQMPHVDNWYDLAYCRDTNTFVATALQSNRFAILKIPTSS